MTRRGERSRRNEQLGAKATPVARLLFDSPLDLISTAQLDFDHAEEG